MSLKTKIKNDMWQVNYVVPFVKKHQFDEKGKVDMLRHVAKAYSKIKAVMVSAEIISDCIRVTQEHGNAITVIPCAEAMMQTEDGEVSIGSYPRDRLKRTQTPQGFRIGDICELHREALKAGITNSVASCTLMIEMGKQVYFSAGSEKNIKLTTVEDIDIFKALLVAKRSDWLK